MGLWNRGPSVRELLEHEMKLTHSDSYCGNRVTDPQVLSLLTESFRIDLMSAIRRIPVNKATHRIYFEEETESSVVIVIEPKDTE